MAMRTTVAGLALTCLQPALAHAATTEPQVCVAGHWSTVAPDPNDPINSVLPVQFETEHFVFHFRDGVASMADAKAAGAHLEYVWGQFTGRLKFPEPYCNKTDKLKPNVFVGADYGLSGGGDAQGHMGMWIGPGGLKDRFGLAHEFTHMLQFATGGLRDSNFTGWIYESHANWMALQLPEFRNNVHCSELLVNVPYLYYGSTRDRYCNWQFLEYIKDRYGYKVVNDIWARSPKIDDPAHLVADPFSVLMANENWSLEHLNDVFGDWALHNVNWDYIDPDGNDEGAVYRKAYGGYEPQNGQRTRRIAELDAIDIDHRRFAIPFGQAPQRWGYDVVPLHPDAGVRQVTVTFQGIVQDVPATTSLPHLSSAEPATIPAPASDWRWSIVAVDRSNHARYAALQRGAKAVTVMDIRDGDRGLYLVVMATPSVMEKIAWDQPWYSIYRYPWMVQIDGALPEGFQPGGEIVTGQRHPNGGGWVAPGAHVDPTAFISPQAKVLSGVVSGRARIEDHVVIDGGTIEGDAIVKGISVINGGTVVKDQAKIDTTFLAIGEFEKNIVVSGNAEIIGDVEERGVSIPSGVYYGFIDRATLDTAKGNAALDSPVVEVTRRPDYHWSP